MPALVAGIHGFLRLDALNEDVDGRNKSGHDGGMVAESSVHGDRLLRRKSSRTAAEGKVAVCGRPDTGPPSNRLRQRLFFPSRIFRWTSVTRIYQKSAFTENTP
jgi:hypothetical protein